MVQRRRRAVRVALRHGYFTTSHPVVSLPNTHPTGAGPTAPDRLALLALTVVWLPPSSPGCALPPLFSTTPDDRRPLPMVGGPVTAAAGLTAATVMLLLIPVPDALAGVLGLMASYAGSLTGREPVRIRRERARDQRNRMGAPLPRIRRVSRWRIIGDHRMGRPPTVSPGNQDHHQSCRGEELKPNWGQRLDDVVGSTTPVLRHHRPTHHRLAVQCQQRGPQWCAAREKIDSTDMFGPGPPISDPKYNEGGDLIGFTVNHQIGAKLAGTDRLFRIARKIGDLGLPGRWRPPAAITSPEQQHSRSAPSCPPWSTRRSTRPSPPSRTPAPATTAPPSHWRSTKRATSSNGTPRSTPHAAHGPTGTGDRHHS